MDHTRVHKLVGILVLAAAVGFTGCDDGDENGNGDAGTNLPDGGTNGNDAGTDGGATGCDAPQTLTFSPGQEQDLQDAVNSLEPCTTIELAAGTFTFDNAITIRQEGITLAGAGKGTKGEGTGSTSSTVLVFTNAASNTNGVDVVGDDFTLRDLAIWNAKKDGLRVESSDRVTIQRVRTEWANEDDSSNGAYGIYPVKSKSVLIEDCEAYNASDAGIYVGQTERAIVRNNVARQNVAGIEIENTQFAEVVGNTAEDNTAGLVVFDLPGNPLAGTDIRVHDNVIRGNNRANFAALSSASSTVSQVPAGTGTFILASRRVELFANTWGDNNTVDVAVLSGLAIEPDPAKWAAGGGNFGTSDIYIHDNTFLEGSGDAVDNGMVDQTNRPLGAALAALYAYGATQGVTRVDPVIWDGIDPNPLADNNANDINLCVSNNTFPAGTAFAVADLNFPGMLPLIGTGEVAAAWDKTTRYEAQNEAYACAGFTPPLMEVTLP